MIPRPCAARHRDPVRTARSCLFCRLATAPAGPPPCAAAPLPVCPHEGPVVEAATCGCDEKHVRHCLHPDAEHGRCTRGPNSGADPDVRSCTGCPLRS